MKLNHGKRRMLLRIMDLVLFYILISALSPTSLQNGLHAKLIINQEMLLLMERLLHCQRKVFILCLVSLWVVHHFPLISALASLLFCRSLTSNQSHQSLILLKNWRMNYKLFLMKTYLSVSFWLLLEFLVPKFFYVSLSETFGYISRYQECKRF